MKDETLQTKDIWKGKTKTKNKFYLELLFWGNV